MEKLILILNYSHSRILCWNEKLYHSDLLRKNIGMLDFEFSKKPFCN